jgi:hypothetical protein
MDPSTTWAALGTVSFIAVHLLAGRFHSLVGSHQRPQYSLLTGATTAYLFLKLLPEVAMAATLVESGPAGAQVRPRLMFAVALAGFIAYYAVEVWAHSSPLAGPGQSRTDKVYTTHLASYAFFNAAVAFLMPHYMAQGPGAGVVYLLAIALHLLVLDHALAGVHGGRYGKVARTVHSGGLILGFALAGLLGLPPPEAFVGPVLAFLAGAITLQVVREEVPEHKLGRPAIFAVGAALMALLILGSEAMG